MKILFIGANPLSTGRLQLDEELRRIENEIGTSKYREQVILKAKHAVRPLELIRELNREKPNILHISAHGVESEGLVLVNEDGTAQLTPNGFLLELFSTLETPPKVVVLNACFTFDLAVEISESVDAVIGIPGPVEDNYAVQFSAAFYMGLAEGVSLSYSFRQALLGARLNRPDYWKNGEPQIINRPGSTTNFKMVETGSSLPSESVVIPRADRRLFDDRDLGRTFIKQEFNDFAERYPSMSLFFFDINGMNRINMNFGRNVGDRVLTEIMVLLERNSPQAIALGICGDDTFFCAIESADAQYAKRFAIRLMDLLETHDWGRLRSGLFVRLNAGYAVWAKSRERATEVIMRAGFALRDSQTASKQIIDGSRMDLTRRVKGSAVGTGKTISEDALRVLFS